MGRIKQKQFGQRYLVFTRSLERREPARLRGPGRGMSRTKVRNVSNVKPEPEGRQCAHHEPGFFLSLCCVKSLRVPVRTCVWSGKNISLCLCFCTELVCFGLGGGGAEARALREELIRIYLTKQSYHQSADCLDTITTAATDFHFRAQPASFTPSRGGQHIGIIPYTSRNL